jgi:hypothetical protein
MILIGILKKRAIMLKAHFEVMVFRNLMNSVKCSTCDVSLLVLQITQNEILKQVRKCMYSIIILA